MQNITPYIIGKLFQTTEEDIINELYSQHKQLLLDISKKTVENVIATNPDITEDDLFELIYKNVDQFNNSFIESGMQKLSEAEKNELIIYLNEQQELDVANKELVEEILQLYEMNNKETVVPQAVNEINYPINLGGVISNPQNPSNMINSTPLISDTPIL